VILIVLTSFTNFRSIHITFYNKTGEDIDSLIIGKTLLGNLKIGEATKQIDFKDFLFDGSTPYEQISGIINSKKALRFNWSWCGTERNTKSKGTYIFDIKKEIDKNGNISLYLVEHNKELFLN
jgi:hypothetical protein